MIVYLETSAFFKLLADEPGGDLVTTLWNAAERSLTSVLTYAEARAGLAAARRAGRLNTADHRHAVRQLRRRWSQIEHVAASERIARHAVLDAERHALRGYDAVHLATARLAGPRSIVFATFDGELARAASSVGLAVAPAIA